PLLLTRTAATEIDPRSLHDALPISRDGPRGLAGRARRRARHAVTGYRDAEARAGRARAPGAGVDPAVLRRTRHRARRGGRGGRRDRKSTRLNSSHVKNSYAVFCLKK